MTRWMALLLALLMGFTGSRSMTTHSVQVETPAVETPAETPEKEEKPAESKQLSTVEPGKLTMATNAQFPPYEYYDGDTLVGIDVEIAAAVAEALDLELVIEDMEFDSLIDAVTNGEADFCMAGIFPTPEREERVDFTESYYTNRQVVIVPEDSDITSPDDLFADDAYHLVGATHSSTGYFYVSWDLEENGYATGCPYARGEDVITALHAGEVDCAILDEPVAMALADDMDGLRILESPYTEEPYAAALGKDNPALCRAVNHALEKLVDDGTVQRIVNKYLSIE